MNHHFRQRLMAYMIGNLSCQEVAALVTDYLDGALSLTQRIRFHMHLGLCVACRNFLKQMRYTISTLRRLPPDPTPPHVKAQLHRRFTDWNVNRGLSSDCAEEKK
ncbi:MAG: zf-HC2 domain-containing protein [Nitrospirales bacterium]|nr:zf-HC2 domain-containing protein [Nitrospirales bacterium]